jgi:prevent-host-death family protein
MHLLPDFQIAEQGRVDVFTRDHVKMTIVMNNQIAAGEFKAKCLALLDEVHRQRKELVITKRGKPVAKLVPIIAGPPSFIGSMRGTMEIVGDIVSPIDVKWEADE